MALIYRYKMYFIDRTMLQLLQKIINAAKTTAQRGSIKR